MDWKMAIKNPKDGKYIPDTAHNRGVIRSDQLSNSNSNNGYYQSQDSYIGSYSEVPFLVKIVAYKVGLGLFYEALKMITSYLVNYIDYSYPYKPIAMFYNYTITIPYKTVDTVWYWLAGLEWPWLVSLEWTSAENISFIIACAGIAIYIYVLLFIYNMWINTVAKIFRDPVTNRPSKGAAWLIFLMPGLFALVWFGIPFIWNLAKASLFS